MTEKPIWAYCRVSTRKAEQELSLEEQESWARSFARQRGCSLVVFSERASAKTIEGRPECVRMLNALSKATAPSVVVATSFDRLSRDITDTLVLARALRNAGTELYVRDRGVVAMDSFADQASLVGQAMGGHAENEARSNRIRASWERRRREGKPTSNKSPYGLQLQNETDVPAGEAAVWVRNAFAWYQSGIGMHRIAKRFQASAPEHRVRTSRIGPDGAPVVRVRKPVWESNRIRKLLGQPRYRGTIVEPDLYDQVQEILGARPRWKAPRKFEYPLSGAIKCATCGRSYHGHATGGTKSKRRADGSLAVYTNARQVRYYQCTVCHYIINASKLEQWFWRDIKALTASPELVSKWLADPHLPPSSDLESELSSLEVELARTERRRQSAWDMALDATPEIRIDLPKQLRQISEREATLRDRMNELRGIGDQTESMQRSASLARTLVQQLPALFDAADYEQQRELCSAMVRALGGAVATKTELVWKRASSEDTRIEQPRVGPVPPLG